MKKIIYLILLIIPLTISCSDFLDVNPKANVVDKDLFKDPQGFEDALYGVYSSLASSANYGRNMSWYLPDVLAQNLGALVHSTIVPLSQYNYTNSYVQTMLADVWGGMYETIGYANNVIRQLEAKDENSMALYRLYYGEALGVRAYLHFDLLRLFAPHIGNNPSARGIPYVTEYSYKVTPFSTVEEVYGKVISDLQKAEQLLQEDETLLSYPREINAQDDYATVRETHFNLYAVWATLARVYWMKGDLNTAKEYALKVIDSGKFPLADRTEIEGLVAGTLSPKESIWGIYSRDYLSLTKDYLYNYVAYRTVRPYTRQTGAYYEEPYELIYTWDVNEGDGTDFRINWFKSDICRKVVDFYTLENSVPDSRKELNPGISMLRSVEMYYITAEALLHDGYTDEATVYVDSVLESRGLLGLKKRTPAVTLTQDFIDRERRKEFFCEGQEWYRMKRVNQNIVSNAESKTIPGNPELYILPIPTTEFDYRNY